MNVTLTPPSIEVARVGSEPLVTIRMPEGQFTLDQLRQFAVYLNTVADEESARKPEPDVDELAAVLEATQGRWLVWDSAKVEFARAVLAAGYKRQDGGQ